MSGPGHGRPVGALLLVLLLTSSLSGTVQGSGNGARGLGPDIAVLDIWAEENMTVRCNITNLGGPFTGFFVLNLTANGAYVGSRTVGWNDIKGSLVVTFDDRPKWTGPKLKVTVNIYDPQRMIDDSDSTNDKRTETWERALPDLVVRSFYRDPEGGKAVSIIGNIGSVKTTDHFYVALFIEGISEPWGMVFDPIHPGATLKVPLLWKWDRVKSPVVNISVMVDVSRDVNEASEDNNHYNVTWKARLPLQFTFDPQVQGVGTDNATIKWGTTVPTTATLMYGTGSAHLTSLPSRAAPSVKGSVEVKALSSLTQYVYKVVCTDGDGRAIESETSSFITKKPTGTSSLTGEIKGSLMFNRTTGVVVPFRSSSTHGVSKVMVYLDGTLVKTIAGGRSKDFRKDIFLGPDALTKAMTNKNELLIRIEVIDIAGGRESYTATMAMGSSLLTHYPKINLTIIPGTESGTIGLSARVRDPKGITDVTWKIDGHVLRRQVPVLSDTTFFFASVDWDSTLYPDGRRRVTLEANNTEGNTSRMSMYVSVDNFLCTGDPDVGIWRDNLVRTRSVVTVRLHVGNWGTEAAVNVRLQDLVKGYVPIESGLGSEMYTSDGRIWTVKREIDRLAPGETVTLEYRLIPALLSREDEHTIGHSLNHPDTPAIDIVSTVCDYEREDGEIRYQWARDLPALQFVGGDFPETGAERAITYANYMVLTNPSLLSDQLGEFEASRIIIKAAELAAEKYGIMGFIVYSSWTDPYPRPSDILAKITEWSALMNPLFPMAGYLAILGEDGVVPTWTYEDVVEFTDVGWQDVPLSDHGYSDLDGDGLPDLAVGRFIGRTSDEIKKPIQTSLDVMNGDTENQNDGKALLISGAGNGVQSFRDHLGMLEDDISPDMDSCTHIDKSEHLAVLDIPVEFDGRSEAFTSGDVDGDGKDEVILYSQADTGIKIYNDDGSSSKISWLVRSTESMVCGDVMAGSNDEILIFYWNHDHTRVRVLNSIGAEIDNKPVPWDVGSPVCLADQDGDGHDDVIFASVEDDEVWVYDHDRTFDIRFDVPDVQPGQRIGAGDMEDDGDLDIVIADHQNDVLRVFRAPTWDELDIPVTDLAAEDGFAVGHFSGRAPAEAAVMRRDSGGHLQVCWIEDDGTGTWVARTEKKFLTSCRTTCAATIGDFVGDGGKLDVMFCTEGEPGNLQVLDMGGVDGRFEAAVRAEMDDVDLLVFSDHGGQDSWSGLMDQSDVPSWNMNTWTHRPVIYAAACSTGDYRSGPDSMATACLRNGAGAYVGATRSSQISENNLAMQFLNDYVAGMSIGMALRNYERRLLDGDLGVNARLANKWAYEYQLFGDPAFGTYAGIARGRTDLPGSRSPEVRTVSVPDPIFLGSDDGVEALFPEGNRLMVEGRPMVPFRTLTFELPPNTTVANVSVVSDGVWTYYEGLDLSIYSGPEWAGIVPSGSRDPVSEDPEDLWYPSGGPAWTVRGGGGRAPELVVNIFPFQYSQGDLLGRYCRNWTVSFETFGVPAVLTDVVGPSHPVIPGGNATLSISLLPVGTGGAVSLSIGVRPLYGTSVQSVFADVMDINATTDLEVVWDTAGTGPGTFEFLVEARDLTGRSLNMRSVPFQIGQLWLVVEGPHLVEPSFRTGNGLNVSCDLRNVGDITVRGNTTFELVSLNGTVLINSSEYLELAPGGSGTIDATITVPNVPDDVLTVIAVFIGQDLRVGSRVDVPRNGSVIPVPIELTLVMECNVSRTNITEGDDLWFNGSVRRSDELAMTNISVGARTMEGMNLNSTRTDGTGSFSLRVDGLIVGNWTVMVGAKGGTLEVWRSFFIQVRSMLPDDNGTDDNTTDDDDDDNVTDDDDDDDNVTDDDDDDVIPDDDDGKVTDDDDGDNNGLWGWGLGISLCLVIIILVMIAMVVTVVVMRRKVRSEDWEE